MSIITLDTAELKKSAKLMLERETEFRSCLERKDYESAACLVVDTTKHAHDELMSTLTDLDLWAFYEDKSSLTGTNLEIRSMLDDRDSLLYELICEWVPSADTAVRQYRKLAESYQSYP